MIGVWVDVYMCECVWMGGCRSVRQGDRDSDSDGSAGHVWAAVIDARGTVISKTFQGCHDSTSYVCVCWVFVWVCANILRLFLYKMKPAWGSLKKKNRCFVQCFFLMWIKQMLPFMQFCKFINLVIWHFTNSCRKFSLRLFYSENNVQGSVKNSVFYFEANFLNIWILWLQESVYSYCITSVLCSHSVCVSNYFDIYTSICIFHSLREADDWYHSLWS